MRLRLDVFLMENGYAESREKAKSMIMAGIVYVNNQKSDKAGNEVNEKDKIEIRGEKLKYVSRGGLKLEKAIIQFGINLENLICGDFGASTGGFTDCMLQNKAQKVYSVDVGYGQLAWSLRNNPAVINMERTNIRYLTKDDIKENLNFISVDVSFISLKLILPVVYNLLSESGECICLIKPQFEAGRDKVGKKGVVKDKSVHLEVVNEIILFSKKIGFKIKNLTYSPIRGPEGNMEYLLYISKSGDCNFSDELPHSVVNDAHLKLD